MTSALPPLKPANINIAPLVDRSVLDGFSCGERQIDRAVEKCCSLNSDHKARTFCASMPSDLKAVGFYTLSIMPADGSRLDPDITRGTYGHIPFIYLNYLAVREDLLRRRIGTFLLGHALDRCIEVARNVGSYGVALHALNDVAEGIYSSYGFAAVDSKKMPMMILPVKSLFDIAKLKEQANAGTGAV